MTESRRDAEREAVAMKPMFDVSTGRWFVRVAVEPPTMRQFDSREDAIAWVEKVTRGW